MHRNLRTALPCRIANCRGTCSSSRAVRCPLDRCGTRGEQERAWQREPVRHPPTLAHLVHARRWFSVEAVPTSSGTEYVLCYRTLRCGAAPRAASTTLTSCALSRRSSLHVRGFVLLREVALVLPCTRTPPAEILLGNQSSENSKARLLRGFLKHRVRARRPPLTRPSRSCARTAADAALPSARGVQDLCFEIRSESRNFVLRCPNRIAFAKWVAGLQRVCALPPLGGAMWPSALGERAPASYSPHCRAGPLRLTRSCTGGRPATPRAGAPARGGRSPRGAAP